MKTHKNSHYYQVLPIKIPIDPIKILKITIFHGETSHSSYEISPNHGWNMPPGPRSPGNILLIRHAVHHLVPDWKKRRAAGGEWDGGLLQWPGE